MTLAHASPPSHREIDAVRRFSRFYTQKIGALQEGLLNSHFSLPEARVLYELANRQRPTASDLVRELAIDAGYLSRILASFTRRGLISRRHVPHDRRCTEISLTPRGRAAFKPLDESSRAEMSKLLTKLSPSGRRALVGSLAQVEHLLEASADAVPTLRAPIAGDMGWVVAAHGRLYADEYEWDWTFEALVAEIVAQFVTSFDPRRERCWIAEQAGQPVGSVFVVRATDTIAKLRLLLVEPSARGFGIGQRLVEACIGFAREARYRTLTLWTNDVLHAARRIYIKAGFELVAEERHHSFGHNLVGQNWELAL